jgi:Fe-S-cluster containining protein
LQPLASLQRLLHAEADGALEAAFAAAEARAGRPYACRAGCSACCHQLVLCTAPEALLIAHALRATLTAGALAATLARLGAQAAAAAGLDSLGYSRARIPCAFLDAGGACSIYAVRPLACRALKSFSVSSCERVPASPADLGAHRIPGSGPGLRIAKAVGVQHYRKLAQAGAFGPRDFTLVLPRAAAIAVAAGEDDALPDFGPARIDVTGPVQTSTPGGGALQPGDGLGESG